MLIPGLSDEFAGLVLRQVLVQLAAGQHAGGEVAGAQALGRLHRQGAIGRRPTGLNSQLVAQVIKDLLASSQSTTDRAADPGPRAAVRRVLLEEAIEAERVL